MKTLDLLGESIDNIIQLDDLRQSAEMTSTMEEASNFSEIIELMSDYSDKGKTSMYVYVDDSEADSIGEIEFGYWYILFAVNKKYEDYFSYQAFIATEDGPCYLVRGDSDGGSWSECYRVGGNEIDESDLVHKSGTETITGDKKFTGSLVIPTGAPSSYVKGAIWVV